MNQYEQIKKTKIAEEALDTELYFENPALDFVLATNDDARYIIGVNDHRNGKFIYKPFSCNPVKCYEDIHYKSRERRELYDECVEGYVLSCLCGEYELAYMNINLHADIWMFIDSFIDEIDYMLKDGVEKYLKFCLENGITRKVLEIYGETLLPDLYDVFLEKQEEIHIIKGKALNINEVLCGETNGI